MYSTLINASQLAARLHAAAWIIVDCRFDLQDIHAGARSYRQSHIPGAVYVDLERDLSSAPVTDCGRHPLPDPQRLAALYSRLGISNGTQVIAYDLNNGVAARFWWMLRYLGHDAVAVLDGGWQAWCVAGGAVSTQPVVPEEATFNAAPVRDRLVTLSEIESVIQLVDAREPGRYRGEFEPIDPLAGHIPGALNHYWQRNLDDAGTFLEPARLVREWQASLGAAPTADTAHYCGSGVTACHNALAQVVAGFPMPRVYVGSWSEWCREPGRPITTMRQSNHGG